MKQLLNSSFNLEHKEKWNIKCLESICGFANSNGGIMQIGVKTSGQVVGISNPSQLTTNISNQIRDLEVFANIVVKNKNTKPYIEITIKPSANLVVCEGKYFQRLGMNNVRLENEALTERLHNSYYLPWDLQIQNNASMAAINTYSVNNFKKSLNSSIEGKKFKNLTTVSLFQKLGLTTGQGLTNAAMILFGKHPNKFTVCPKVCITRFDKFENKILSTHEFKGNIIQLVYKVFDKFSSILKISNQEYQVELLRAVIANSFVHRNYLLADAIEIKVYDNKFTIWSPGKLMPSLNINTLSSNNSESLLLRRNPLIADVCFNARFFDSSGTGLKRVKELSAENDYLPPKFKEINGGFQVDIFKEIVK